MKEDKKADSAAPETGLLMLAAGAASDVRTLADLLDQLDIGCCVYDEADAVVLWNATYLRFFPEQEGSLAPGTTYADTLRRFFASNLAKTDLADLEHHVAAGVHRHHEQAAPFIFQRRNGRWLKVASLKLPGGGRARLWRDVTGEHAGAGQPPAARALAALDTAYAVFDPKGGFVTANKRYQELFAEIGDLVHVGAAYRDHLRRIGRHALEPEDGATLRRFAVSRGRRGDAVVMPMLLHRKGGGWLQLEERRGDDGTLVALWTDATRHALAQAEIDRLQAHLQDAIEAIPHGIVLFEATGAVALVNRRLASIDGRLAEDLVIGAPLDVLAAWRAGLGQSDAAQDAAARLHDGHAPEEIPLADGRWVRIAPLRTSHGDLLVLLTDVTREREADAEIARQRDLAHQNEKLAALGSVLAGVAHELNNPLSVVVGRASMLEEDATEPALVAKLRSLRVAAERCAKIVRTFLAVARQKPRERRPLEARAQLDAALEMLAYGLETAGIAVERRYRDGGAHVLAEEDALNQVFLNLIANAQHALADAPPPRRLILKTERRGELLQIVVADTGPGVAATIRPRVFDPFFTTKPVGMGTGIGLAVCHGIVTAHGGTITVGDRTGGGARFTVRLPITPAFAPAPPPAAPTLPTSSGRVLIVDDEAEICDIFARILERRGYTVSVAADGGEALARLDAAPCDVVVTDLRMPGLDGRELVRRLARRPMPERPALIVVTGDPLGAAPESFAIDPPPLVLEKPVEPGALVLAVAALIARRTPPSQ